MQSADDLHEEARRRLDAIKDTADAGVKRELATDSFELVPQAGTPSPRLGIADERVNAGRRQI